MTALVLGPHLRHVSSRTATIFVEVDRPCEVRVVGEGVDAAARTFTVHGHHYAVVDVDGLPAGARVPYEVIAGGETVWPLNAEFPPSLLRTLPDGGDPLRIAFGSCRRSPGTVEMFGHDALTALARRLRAFGDGVDWPDVLLMVGDQVYADELGDEMLEYIRERRGDEPPVGEVADYEEYVRLYELAWREDAEVRWLLSTVPTFTVFDDHDIRDDWNTSYAWREEMWAQPWWRARITGGIGSYWVYQHLGNLSPRERADDPIFAQVRAASDATGDAGDVLDAFSERADREPESMRWSYAHDFGGVRFIVVDSRCSRLLTPDRRGMLDDREFAWLGELCQGDVEHLVIASSLPFLLPRAIHDAENWNEAISEGAWGRPGAALGERMRQAVDLEHWAAFDRSFREVASHVLAVGRGERGAVPASITFLSGDVHFSYLARVDAPGLETEIAQIVCSPFRNPLDGKIRIAQRIACMWETATPFRWLGKLAKVPPPPLKWRVTHGPWFDNAIATVTLAGRDCDVAWESPRNAGTLVELGRADITG
ncbi:alkaline phosphatase D family protein [Actinomadura sediminis]